MKKSKNIFKEKLFFVNPITTKWEKIGFLDKLDSNLKTNVATTFEDAYNLILENPKKYEIVNTVVFPIIRRIYTHTINSNTNRLFNAKTILSFVYNEYENNYTRYLHENCLQGIDCEAQFCEDLSIQFISQYVSNR